MMVGRGSSGSILAQALIAIPIVAILGLAVGTMIFQLNQQTAVINQKLEAADLRALLGQVLGDSQSCLLALQGHNLNLTGATVSKAANDKIVLNEIRAGSASGMLIASKGKPLGSGPQALMVKSIEFSNIRRLDPADSTKFVGDFVVSWDPSRLKMSLKPIEVTRVITVDGGPLSAKKVTACASESGSGALGDCRMYNLSFNTNYFTGAAAAQCKNVSPSAGGSVFECACPGSEKVFSCHALNRVESSPLAGGGIIGSPGAPGINAAYSLSPTQVTSDSTCRIPTSTAGAVYSASVFLNVQMTCCKN